MSLKQDHWGIGDFGESNGKMILQKSPKFDLIFEKQATYES